MFTTPNNGSAAAGGLPLIPFLSDRLQPFLAPVYCGAARSEAFRRELLIEKY
jgi:hypothetical protein